MLVALGQDQPSLALGNLMGSSVANILASFALGVVFLKGGAFDKSSKIYTAALLASCSVFLLFLYALRGPTQKFVAGVALLLGFAFYVASVASLIYQGALTAPESDSDDSDSDSDSGSSSDDDEEVVKVGERSLRNGGANGHALGGSNGLARRTVERLASATGKSRDSRGLQATRSKRLWEHVAHLSIGMAALLVASYIVGHSAQAIGAALGLSGGAVGTTILSLATTIPEKFVAIMSGVRKQPGIMVANTAGSNIFLATLCGGVLLVWGDAGEIENGFTAFEALAMWASAALLFCVVMAGSRPWIGVAGLCLYVAFLVVEFANGRVVDVD
jgi:Ca2+/Na+ antiporter